MAHIVGDSAPNFLLGGNGHDLIQGSGGDDVLYGRSGNDTLDGGLGADYLHGGDGLDYADYFNSTAVLVDLGNNSAVGGQAFGDYFVSIEGVLGSGQGDWIIGTAGFNVFYGRGGRDRLDGAGGGDLIYGQEGNDVIEGGEGNDDLLGGAGADRIDGGPGFDIAGYNYSSQGVRVSLLTGRGAGGEAEGDILTNIERVDGSAHDDTLAGNALDNELFGGEGGFDRLSGGEGNDRITGSGAMAGNAGNDSIFGGYFFATSLQGGADNDYLIGGGHNDTVSGGLGNDRLAGAGGADRLTGGLGADIFWYVFGAGDSLPGQATQDQVFDFSKAEGDKVDLTSVFDNPDTEADELLQFIGTLAFGGAPGQLRFVTNAANNVSFIQADIDGNAAADLQVRFTGVIAFTASDFLL